MSRRNALAVNAASKALDSMIELMEDRCERRGCACHLPQGPAWHDDRQPQTSHADAPARRSNANLGITTGNGNNRYSSSTANGSGYYAGRNPASPRPVEDPYQPTPIAAPGRNRFGQRVQQDMMPPRPPVHGQGMYPGHSYQQSRDTVNTGYSNSSGEPWGNSTDPSSENSSIERMPAQKQPDLGEQYGFNGFGGNPIAEEYDYNNNEYDQQNYAPAPAVGNGAYYNQNQGAPPVPSKMGDGPPQQPITAAPARRPVMNGDGEKRKSWFKRRFSKD